MKEILLAALEQFVKSFVHITDAKKLDSRSCFFYTSATSDTFDKLQVWHDEWIDRRLGIAYSERFIRFLVKIVDF